MCEDLDPILFPVPTLNCNGLKQPECEDPTEANNLTGFLRASFYKRNLSVKEKPTFSVSLIYNPCSRVCIYSNVSKLYKLPKITVPPRQVPINKGRQVATAKN